MGILQSVLQYLSSDTGERETAVSSLNSYSSNNSEKLEQRRQWRNEHHQTRSHDSKYLAVTVPNLKDSSSSSSSSSPLTHTSVNHKLKGSASLVKQNTTQTVHRRETIRIGSCSGEEKQRKEGTVIINCTAVAPEGRWIKHYSSCHLILLVGDGDFSFSTCLAAAFGWASNMIATSLDSQAFLVKNYHNALSNLVELSIRKCRVMHEIDATTMANHPFLGEIKFDRIIFNFPFAGFFKDMSRDSQLRRHRSLVSRFLMNAKEMIRENGEIHITHKTNGFHMEWKLESIASSHKLRFVEAVDFHHMDYPGYNTKCGFGGDNNFNCYPSKTYKFGL